MEKIKEFDNLVDLGIFVINNGYSVIRREGKKVILNTRDYLIANF